MMFSIPIAVFANPITKPPKFSADVLVVSHGDVVEVGSIWKENGKLMIPTVPA